MAYKLGVTNHLLHGMILQVTGGVRGFFVGKHSGLGCAYRDELEWAAWMTIFPIKWRANEQQGKGWAPTRGKFFVFLAWLAGWFCFFPTEMAFSKTEDPSQPSWDFNLIEKNIRRVEIVAKLFTYFWVYNINAYPQWWYCTCPVLILTWGQSPLKRWLIEQLRHGPNLHISVTWASSSPEDFPMRGTTHICKLAIFMEEFRLTIWDV